MKPLFSIITTTYNCGSKIDHTWASLLAQDFADFEYQVIDGNSKDGTQERLAAIKDSRVQFCSEPDRGIYDAMNKGIARAQGRYLFFLGAGDWLLPGVLQKISLHLAESNDVLVYGNVLMGTEESVYDGRFSRLKRCH